MPTGVDEPDQPDARITAADVVKAEAEAQKAKTEATAAARVEAEASSELAGEQRAAEARKAVAEARQAAAEADQAARAARVEVDPALQRQQKEAEVRKATADADKAAADAKQAQISALLPDFSKVEVPATKIEGDQALRGNDLARHALRTAARALASDVLSKSPHTGSQVGRGRILITSDPDLATTDGAYVEVNTGLDRLLESAEQLNSPPRPIAPPVIAAVATMIPGLVSMLAPRRTLSSRAVADDDTAAVAEVAGALAADRDVRLDDFRLVPDTEVVARERRLRIERDRLVKFKLDHEQLKTQSETLRANAQAQLDALLKLKVEPTPGTIPAEIDVQIAAITQQRDEAIADLATATVRAELAGTLLAAIDAFFIAIHFIRAEAKRSAFVAAALHEELRKSAPGARVFDHVLFVKGSGGTVDQLLEEVFFRKDRVEVIASVSISYWLMDPATSNIVAGGVVTRSSRLSGKIGDELKITAMAAGAP